VTAKRTAATMYDERVNLIMIKVCIRLPEPKDIVQIRNLEDTLERTGFNIYIFGSLNIQAVEF